jgi:hypothetical protein
MTSCLLVKAHVRLLRPSRMRGLGRVSGLGDVFLARPTAPGGLVSRFSTTAQVLRLLGSCEWSPLDGNIELLRSVFRISAEACERLEETDRQLSQALLRIADLEALLARVVEVLETAPLPVDGGSWAVLKLAQEIQRTLAGGEPG